MLESSKPTQNTRKSRWRSGEENRWGAADDEVMKGVCSNAGDFTAGFLELNHQMILFLTGRAVVSAAIADGHSLDRAGTDPAWFAVAIVDPQMVLEFAALVIGIAIVGE